MTNTPLYAAMLDFFVKNPDYKITAEEFVGLTSMLSAEVLK